MRREITNSQLWIIENDLLQLPQRSPGLAFLQESRMQTFFQRNQMLLKILHSRMHEIQKKYIVHDEKNQPQHENEEKKEWKYLDSVIAKNGELITGDQVKERYHEEVSEFLDRTVKVEL